MHWLRSLATIAVVSLAVVAGAGPVRGANPSASPAAVLLQPASGALATSGLSPGAERFLPLLVTNPAASPLRYLVAAVAKDTGQAPGLGRALQAEIRRVGTRCTAEAFTRSVRLIAGPVSLSALRSAAPVTLAGAEEHLLCVRLWMPEDASNSLQGAGVDVVLTFESLPLT